MLRVSLQEAIDKGWVSPAPHLHRSDRPSKARNTGEGTPQYILYRALKKKAPNLRIEWEKAGLIKGRKFVVDIYIPDGKLCIEIDGFQYHRSLNTFKKDRHRQNLFVLHGYRVLRYHTGEIFDLEARRTIVEEILEFTTRLARSHYKPHRSGRGL